MSGPVFHGMANGAAGGIDVGDIANSLRFRAANSAYLSRTFGTPTDNKKWSMSMWVKRGSLGANRTLFSANEDGANYWDFRFDSADNLRIQNRQGAVNLLSTNTSAVFRDPSAWMHILFVFDSANATATNRNRLYVNGTELFWSANSALNDTSAFNVSGEIHVLGISRTLTVGGATWAEYDGHLSRICFVDGQALTPSSFITFNSTINEWVSKSQADVKAVVDAGGTNSFMLDFDDATSTTTLGYDKSSKGNNWTCNNISLTSGVTYDHMTDVPGNSYATLNPLPPNHGSIRPTDGNLRATEAGGYWGEQISSIGMKTGKWVWQIKYTTKPSSTAMGAGVVDLPRMPYNGSATGKYRYCQNGQKNLDGTASAFGNAWNNGDLLRFEFDADAGTLACYRNNSLEGTITGIPTGVTYHTVAEVYQGDLNANYGQQPWLSGETPSTGFLALCQENVTTPAILNPKEHHNVYTVTKSGNTNFTLDWDGSVYDTYFEIKRRDSTGDWYNVDGLRGYDKILKSNTTDAETTDANVISVSGATCTLKSTLTDGTYVIAAWKAGLTASRQTNTDGSITSTVSRNVTSGFAIVLYTGTGANATVGHGLGVVPAEIVARGRGYVASWIVSHTSIGTGNALILSSTAAVGSGWWNNTAPTSSVFSLDASSAYNTSGQTEVAYVHAEIPGYSKFGSAVGNGNAGGLLAFCGFKSRWMRWKASSTTSSWNQYDTARDTDNVTNLALITQSVSAERTDEGDYDITSNSIKSRSVTGTEANANGVTYIFSAYADVAGNYSLAR